jgi:uncharacterized protein (DUF1684 family)
MAESSTYIESIQSWQTARNKKLREPDSWLTLAGLFWLEPGHTSTIGSAESGDFVLPKGSAPAQIGKLRLDGETVVFTNLGGAAVTVNDEPVTSDVTLHYKGDKPDTVQVGNISFFVIKRGDKFGLRAKDSESPVLKNFQGLTYFPIRPELRFEARLIPDPKKVPILNAVGQTDLEESPGVVEFTYQGKTYRLRPIYEDKTLFFLFKDATNKTQTYQAGRFLNTPLPVDGKVELDFNRSYNPPCTFTPYATCPLPPKENALSIPIEAGELRYGNGHVE